MSILSVRNLSKAFGGVHAVDNVSFDMASGEVLGVIGPNGAGKTSLFDCLSGLLTVTEGAVELAGQDITAMPPQKRLPLRPISG